MLGYEKDDLKNMIHSVESAAATVDSDNDPWLYGSLVMTQDFLSGLLAEGHFD
jgi:hypothetical protein